MWGVQGWWASLLPHLPSHALGDSPVQALPSIPGATLSPWQNRTGHWLKTSRAFALYQDLQLGWGRCQPAVNGAVPEQNKNSWGSWEQGKGWGCCKSLPNTGTPSKSHHGAPALLWGWGGAPLSPAPPGQGDILWAGSCIGHPVCSGAVLGLVPRQEGRVLGRAGRGALAGKGSGVSCRAQCGFQKPWWDCSGPSTAQSQPHLGWG